MADKDPLPILPVDDDEASCIEKPRCPVSAEEGLIAEGWERRYLADPRMAKEAISTYSELGYEVRLEAMDTDRVKDECSGCKAILERFSVVYTRKIAQ